MNDSNKLTWPARAVKWFDPRGRSIDMLGFILNRITALGLTLYLFLHLIMLGQLAIGEKAYDSFLAVVHHPLFTLGELLVIAAGCLHGLNGIRIALISVGIGTRYQKAILILFLGMAIVGTLYFAYFMLRG